MSLLLVIFFSCANVCSSLDLKNKLAIASQGSSKMMIEWINSSQLYMSYNFSHLFILSFDSPILHDSCVSDRLIVVYHVYMHLVPLGRLVEIISYGQYMNMKSIIEAHLSFGHFMIVTH